MIQRRVTIFCKLAIFWVVMVSGENFKVRAPKCCAADYKQSKASWRRSKCYYRYHLYYAWAQNVITDGTFITLGSKSYYRWDLYYTWVQLLHLCLLQTLPSQLSGLGGFEVSEILLRPEPPKQRRNNQRRAVSNIFSLSGGSMGQ